MKKNTEIKINHSMKDAYIEQVIIWMVIFVGFATLFFFTIDYSVIIKVSDNMSALSDYGARRVSVNGSGVDIISDLNDMKVKVIQTIGAGDLVCNSTSDSLSKVIFTTQIDDPSYKFVSEDLLSSRKAVFNEVNTDTVTCTLTIDLTQ